MIFTKLLLTTILLFPIKNSKKDIQQVKTEQVSEEISLDFTYSFIPAAGVTIFEGSTNISIDSIQKGIWDFGDGTQSINEQSPKHFYETPGVYNVTLTIYLKNGEEKSISKSVSWLVNNNK